MSKRNSTRSNDHNQTITDLSTRIEEFEQQNNVVLFDDERIASLPVDEIKLIDELNETINPHSLCKKNVIRLTEKMLPTTPERVFFELLVSSQ